MAELHILGKYTPYGATQVPPRADGSNKYFLFASEGGSKLDHEEEIYFCGKTVIWSSGQTVKKSFTLEHDIIQVVWTTFVPNSPRTDLCVLHTGTPQPSFSFHILTKSFWALISAVLDASIRILRRVCTSWFGALFAGWFPEADFPTSNMFFRPKKWSLIPIQAFHFIF
jgi:hypothetical protein